MQVIIDTRSIEQPFIGVGNPGNPGNPGVSALAGITAMGIALVTASCLAMRAVLANPVVCLRAK